MYVFVTTTVFSMAWHGLVCPFMLQFVTYVLKCLLFGQQTGGRGAHTLTHLHTTNKQQNICRILAHAHTFIAIERARYAKEKHNKIKSVSVK